MENLLINYLLTNCKALTKEFFSQEKPSTGDGESPLDFLSILNNKMGSDANPIMDGMAQISIMAAIAGTQGSGVAAAKGAIDGTPVNEEKSEAPQENEKQEEGELSLSTQNIFALLQTYFHLKDPQEGNLQDRIEKFLNDVFDFLQDGESVEFMKEKGSADLFALIKGNEKETGEVSEDISDGSQKKPENVPLMGYLAAMFHQMGAIEKGDGKNRGPKVEESDGNGVSNTINKIVDNENSNTDKNEINGGLYNLVTGTVNNGNGNAVKSLVNKSANGRAENITDKRAGNNAAGNGEKHKVLIGKEAFQVFNKPEMIPGLDVEEKQNDDVAKSFQRLEVTKIGGRENVFRIIAHESTAIEGDEPVNNISVLTIKAEKAIFSHDDDSPKVVFKISDKEIDDNIGKDERQLLPQNDYTKMSTHSDKETAKVVDKTAFASMMADRIEKIAEQYGNKTFSMDMVIRLKIDDKESILVGLKEQGNRISVEVKTTNEGMGSYLQSQKEEIAKQLEGKFVYANIYVDVQNEGSRKKEQKEQQKKRSQEEEQKGFGVFLEALA